MAIAWIFKPHMPTHCAAHISSQLSSLNKLSLSLRNPWVSDSVFMGKLYVAMTLGLALYCYSGITEAEYRTMVLADPHSLMQYIVAPLIFTPFLAYRIFFIKTLSEIHFNRETKRILYQRNKKLISFDWGNVEGGVFKRTEFGGSSFSTTYALAFAPRREDGSLHQKDCLWVDSNEPTESDIQYVAEVWEYLRHFMDHGPDNLPPPGEPNWWHKPLHAICLTPAEAWRHYVPWRTGEPGEMQGKKNWQLPFWAVLLPYNLTVAICWYFICKLFNVRAAPPPAEAFEGAPANPE
ncbi:DUF6708 domain-containing protein [Pseudomonas sp. NPDC096925]|uniref:DUF6708 domain-containing protein n=3 Tax=Pseudomonas TaxID=286 RepID=UPI00383BDE80